MRRLRPALVVVACALGLAACGDSSTGNNSGATSPDTTAAINPTASTNAAPSNTAPVTTAASEQWGVGVIEVREFNSYYRGVLIDERQMPNPADFEDLAKRICGDLSPCQVGIWNDRSNFPSGFPIPQAQLVAESFNYGQDLSVPRVNAHWNCDYYPQYEELRRCLPRLLAR